MPHETEAQHLDGQLREALKDRAAAIKQAQEAHAEAAALKAELHEARMQSIVDFGKLQKACEERDALKEEVERLREERNEFASHVVEFSELAASLIEEMSKKPNTTWGQVKAAIRALGDLGDRSAYQIKQKSRAALHEKTDD